MKPGNLARAFDLAGQLATLFPLFVKPHFSAAGIALAYLLLGLWQVLSFMIHCSASPAGRRRRRNYGIALLATLVLVGIMSWLRLTTPETQLATSAVVCGVLAIWYACIGVRELIGSIQLQQHRREIHWKL